VVGRGLRRTSYSDFDDKGLFKPEYVNIFGVPFTFLPHEGGNDTPPPPPTPKTRIEAVKAKEGYAIRWPNVIRIDHVYHPRLDRGLGHPGRDVRDQHPQGPVRAVRDRGDGGVES
jgi:type III restriction enzyme